MVLLPGTVLPLHVFEPRYRTLIADCLAADPILGIATVQTGGADCDRSTPQLFPEIGVGRIVQYQPFRDGRSNIVVEAVERAVLVAELPTSQPYRVATARALPPRDPRGGGVDRLRLLLLQLGTVSGHAQDELRRICALGDLALVDALASRVLVDPDARRAYLGRATFSAQVADVEAQLAELLITGEPSAQA